MDSESDAPTKRIRRYEWDSLRALGSSRVVQLSVLLPVIGYLILFSSELRGYFVLVFDTVQFDSAGNVQPVLWRLYLLYFGFCFVAAASLIFTWKCPAEVKTHGAGFVYLEREGPAISEQRLRSIRERVAVAYLAAQYGWRNARAFLGGHWAPDRPPSEIEKHYTEQLDILESMVRNDVLLQHFVALKQSGKPWRIASRTCYDIGFALLAVPTLHVFVAVIAAVYWDLTTTF